MHLIPTRKGHNAVRMRTPMDVLWWGVGLTAVAVPLMAASLGSNLVMIPLVFLGAGAVEMRIFWRWRRGPFRTVVPALLSEQRSTATYLTSLIGGIGGLALSAFFAVVVTVHWHTKPCFCDDARSLQFLITLALNALISSILANVGLLATVASILWLTQRSRT